MGQEYIVNVTLPGTPERFTKTCDAGVTIGRSPDADIPLMHPHVSRSHVEVALQDDGRFLVRDVSRNGTSVNDELVHESAVTVAAPAVLRVGPYVLTLSPAGMAPEETVAVQAPAPAGRVALDRGLHTLVVDGKPALEGMTGLEYRLVEVLTAARGSLVSNQQLGDALWGGAGMWDAAMLHNLVRRVRRKLEDRGLPADELIVSLPGEGYRVV